MHGLGKPYSNTNNFDKLPSGSHRIRKMYKGETHTNESYAKKLGDGELISLSPECDNVPLSEDSKCRGRVVRAL